MKTLLLMLASMLGLTCAQQSPVPPNENPRYVLRSYDVPEGRAAQVNKALRNVLWLDAGGADHKGQWVGKSDLGPDGRLLVLATEEMQESVGRLVEQLSKAGPSTSRSTIEMGYWLVRGTPAAKDSEHPGVPLIDAALTEIEKNDGPQKFTLEERLSTRGLSGEFVHLQGREWWVDQTAETADNEVRAEIKIVHGPQEMNTRAKLSPGQIVVLGSSGAGRGKDDTSGTLYYLIRAAIHDGPKR